MYNMNMLHTVYTYVYITCYVRVVWRVWCVVRCAHMRANVWVACGCVVYCARASCPYPYRSSSCQSIINTYVINHFLWVVIHRHSHRSTGITQIHRYTDYRLPVILSIS